MKDFFGNTLELEDIVAFCRPNYRDLVTGRVMAFTPQKVRVQYNTSSGTDTYLGDPRMFIKAPSGLLK